VARYLQEEDREGAGQSVRDWEMVIAGWEELEGVPI
jgi:hypothetical protein